MAIQIKDAGILMNEARSEAGDAAAASATGEGVCREARM